MERPCNIYKRRFSHKQDLPIRLVRAHWAFVFHFLLDFPDFNQICDLSHVSITSAVLQIDEKEELACKAHNDSYNKTLNNDNASLYITIGHYRLHLFREQRLE